jgi:phosphoenolpyruvate-protein kinase (PTS system EI component)
MKWMPWLKIGEGISAFSVSNLRARGVLREIETVEDTLWLSEETPKRTIVLMHTAGVTTIAPIFSMVSGIICTTGGPCSHLSILAREFQIPCIMKAKIDYEGMLEGKEVCLELNGSKGQILLREDRET